MLTSVLLVEDDDVEVMSVKRAFRVMSLPHPLVVARDGLEALAILRGNGESKSAASPHLIFLDINMPRMNGIEFLRELRRDPNHARIPIVILTTSMADADRQAAGDAGVAGYIIKSTLEGGFAAFAAAIDGHLKKLTPIDAP